MYHILILQFLMAHLKHAAINGRNDGRNAASLYHMSNAMNISIATLYRKALELMDLGLVIRIGKGHYAITTKGALVLALLYLRGVHDIDLNTFNASISRLKEDWGLSDVKDEEIISYLSLLNKAIDIMRTPIAQVCAKLNSTIHYLLPSSLNNIGNGKHLLNAIAENLGVSSEEVSRAESVIAKALLEFLPTITLKDGCKVAVVLKGDQSRKISLMGIAMRCRIYGYKLGIDCPVIASLLNRLTITD